MTASWHKALRPIGPILRSPAHAEHRHGHVQADECVVDERVLDAGLVFDEFGREREQDRDDAHLPHPGAFPGCFRMTEVVLSLRQYRKERGEKVAEERGKDCFTREPDCDRYCTGDEHECVGLRPQPVPLAHEGSDDDECRGDTPANLDVGFVIARSVG